MQVCFRHLTLCLSNPNRLDVIVSIFNNSMSPVVISVLIYLPIHLSNKHLVNEGILVLPVIKGIFLKAYWKMQARKKKKSLSVRNTDTHKVTERRK